MRGPLARKGGSTWVNYLYWAPEFLVTPLLMGLVCLTGQGRFEEPVLPCF